MLLQNSVVKRSMRVKMEKGPIITRIRIRCLFVSMAVAVWWLFFVSRFVSDVAAPSNDIPSTDLQQGDIPYSRKEQTYALQSSRNTISEKFATRDALSKVDDNCEGRYVYLHDLPREFREGLLDDCEMLAQWSNMCKDSANMGFGQPMEDSEGVFSQTGWYFTDQFTVEVIYHHKMLHYKCRTMDSSQANAIFVPFYSGVEVMPHLWDGANISHRDAVPYQFTEWVTSQPEWARLDGHDHFFIGGRVTWDFRRTTDEESDWGNKLLILEPVRNMSTLTIEASPWHAEDFGIPYPTYFHPSTDQEVFDWQDRVANIKRKSLFCFAGAPRPSQDTSIRGQIMSHCQESEYCNLMECGKNSGECHFPANVMRLFQESHFCLQPPGDSYTRRSLFDSILAGCIPVLFHEYSAYTQYGWFFPASNSSYSVYIDREQVRTKNVSITEVLLSYSEKEIETMRKVVISLIPRILYTNPINEMTLKDAFDLSVDGVLGRIEEYKRSLEVAEEKAKSGHVLKDQAERELANAKSRLDEFLRGGSRQL